MTVVVVVVLDRVAVHGNGGGRTHNLLVNSVSKVKKEEKKIPGLETPLCLEPLPLSSPAPAQAPHSSCWCRCRW